MKAFKGTDKNLQCHNNFQYEIGKEYETDRRVKLCAHGFHACENPLDVFGFYPPIDGNGNLNRFCEWNIHKLYSAKVGEKIQRTKIKADTWYWFEDGKLKAEAVK